MGTRTAPAAPPITPRRTFSRYERVWNTAALSAVGVFASLAVLQSPRLPLLGLTLGLAALGGLILTRSSSYRSAGRGFVEVAIRVGVCVLAVVGAGHHPSAAMATAAVLLGSSPRTLRWVSGV